MAQVFKDDWKFPRAAHLANLATWAKGESPEYQPMSNSAISIWIAEFCGKYNFLSHYSPEHPPLAWEGVTTFYDLALALNCFDPAISRVNGADQIIIYPCYEKRSEAKRLAMNPGKAIRRILPDLPNKYLEIMVSEFKLKFDSNNYQIIWGDTREQFRDSFNSINFDMLENISTTSTRKSLINSCMTQGNNVITGDRYQNMWNGSNPGEAYASPDFRILLAMNASTKKIAARCIVRTDCNPYAHAPIYGTSENVIDIIQAELTSKGARPAKLRMYDAGDSNASFAGARLLCVPVKSGFLAPYQDCIPGKIDAPNNDSVYMTLHYCGDITLHELTGVVSVSDCNNDDDSINCHSCGCGESQDDCYGYNGDNYCESCYSGEFGTCDCCNDTTPNDELQTCYNWNHNRDRVDETYICDHCRGNNYTRIDTGSDSGEFWRESDTVELNDGQTVSMGDYYNGDYFTSDNSGEVYNGDSRIETADGESWAECEAIEAGLVQLADSTWGKPDLESMAENQIELIRSDENQKYWHSLQSGQFVFSFPLPRISDLEMSENEFGETVLNSGLTFWAGIESATLAQYPTIGTLQKEGGNTFYFWKEYDSRIMEDNFHEFATLAECVSAFNQSN